MRKVGGAHVGRVQFSVRTLLAHLIRIIRAVDLYDICTEYGELVGGKRARQNVSGVNDLEAFIGTGHGMSP